MKWNKEWEMELGEYTGLSANRKNLIVSLSLVSEPDDCSFKISLVIWY